MRTHIALAALAAFAAAGCVNVSNRSSDTPPPNLDARLEARFERVCPAGWRTRPAPFGDGHVGVNTVFRPADSQTVADRNILELYFFDTDRELADIPRAPGWPDMVWRVSSHDIAPSYPYQSTGMRVCWRIQ